VRVEGFSMLPTLDNGEYVLISRLAYKLGDYQRGDIIVFRPPMYPDAPFWQRLFGLPGFDDKYEDYIKRIIGLPGDTVRITNGTVYINEAPLMEPYIAAPPDYSNEWTVPEGQLFVLGDNRNNSADSHAWGFLPEENILGKALVVYWPFADFMIIQPHQSVLAAP
jgi:signal peptidase I